MRSIQARHELTAAKDGVAERRALADADRDVKKVRCFQTLSFSSVTISSALTTPMGTVPWMLYFVVTVIIWLTPCSRAGGGCGAAVPGAAEGGGGARR